MIRIACVGDVHYGKDSRGRLASYLDGLDRVADMYLLAGDLTQIGTAEEGQALADDLRRASVPVIAVLGNHDFHSGQEAAIRSALEGVGVKVLEQSSLVFETQGQKVGVVGLKGFGGGFWGACATDFGEAEMKSFVRTTKRQAEWLREHLRALQADYKIVLMHYSPVPDTLTGEKKEIYPFLGSYLLAEAIDAGGADLVFHGHAHHGIEKGATPGGVPVRNVAMPVIRHPFNVYTLNKDGLMHPHAQPAPHRRLERTSPDV